MYILVLVLFSFFGIQLILSGVGRRDQLRQGMGLLILLLTIGFFPLMDLWGEWLWFVAQGYESRFWRLILA